jgi:hypothetical protein
MRVVQKKIFDTVTINANTNSSPVSVEHLITWSIQAVWTGTPTGTFKVQFSNDIASDAIGTGVTNWTDVPSGMFTNGGTAPSGSAGNFSISSRDHVNYEWIRLVYTSTSGTGPCTATMVGKGFAV